jgi:FkbH-like protein
LADRFDLRAETAQGFPYTKRNASAVGQALAELICPCEPKKGLITDLDDVLWAGLLGEVGVDGVHWSLEEDAQLHGIYQQFLASLASAGVLIGGASKNDAALVEQAFAREDLLLPRTSIFPIEAHWAQKSDSVRRILAKWNVLPSAVVFVDDSRMEVAEVQAAFPEMDCLVFPKDDHVAFWQFLYDLRRRFAKTTISEEDQFRLESLRDSAVMQDSASSNHHSLDEFLSDAEGEITFDLTKPTTDLRALELLNKTNQFNLNGRRLDHAEWSRLLGDPERFVLTVSYQDKFGRLGRIAVMIGSCAEKRLVLTHWVMSCRAFSRQIEFHCLDYLFTRFGAAEAVFAVQSTGRNGPLLEFLQRLFDAAAKPNSVLSRAEFTKRAPKLPHKIQEVCALV